MGKICEITHILHQKRHRLASPRRLVLLHASKWVGKSYKNVLHRDNHISMSLEMQDHTHRLHQKRHGLASPRRLVLLHACKWVGKSYKKLYCTEIITQACLLRCKITHTDYSHHWYIRRLQCGHIFMARYAKSHTHIDLARRSILLAGRRSCLPLPCSS
jgi:hypothetical protein